MLHGFVEFDQVSFSQQCMLAMISTDVFRVRQSGPVDRMLSPGKVDAYVAGMLEERQYTIEYCSSPRGSC